MTHVHGGGRSSGRRKSVYVKLCVRSVWHIIDETSLKDDGARKEWKNCSKLDEPSQTRRCVFQKTDLPRAAGTMAQMHGQMFRNGCLLSVFLLGMLVGIALFSLDTIRKRIYFHLNVPLRQSDRPNVSRVSELFHLQNYSLWETVQYSIDPKQV